MKNTHIIKFKKWILDIKKIFANSKPNAFEFPTDSQTLLCLESARLTVDHVVNF